MAIKAPTKKQISCLVGGTPLAHTFDPETGSLVVIAPTGQKVRFSKEHWQKPERQESKEVEEPANPEEEVTEGKKPE